MIHAKKSQTAMKIIMTRLFSILFMVFIQATTGKGCRKTGLDNEAILMWVPPFFFVAWIHSLSKYILMFQALCGNGLRARLSSAFSALRSCPGPQCQTHAWKAPAISLQIRDLLSLPFFHLPSFRRRPGRTLKTRQRGKEAIRLQRRHPFFSRRLNSFHLIRL